jgi:hypothetical protein
VLSAQINSGGSPPYTYSYQIKNQSSGFVVANMTYTNSLTTNTFLWLATPTFGLGTSYGSRFAANVIITDSAGETVNSTANIITIAPFIGSYIILPNNMIQVGEANSIGITVDMDYAPYDKIDANTMLSNGIKQMVDMYDYLEYINPFSVSIGQSTIPIAVPGPASISPLPAGSWNSTGTIEIGNDTVTYNGIILDYATGSIGTYSALTNCVVTGPNPVVAADTAILNSPSLANALQLLHGNGNSIDLWGFYTKDDDWESPSGTVKETDALQQTYRQLKASFPNLPVIAAYGDVTSIQTNYAPGIADAVLLYYYPFGVGITEANSISSLTSAVNQSTTLLTSIGGPRVSWTGVFQAYSPSIPNADEMLKESAIYMRSGSAGMWSFALTYWNATVTANATYAYELATQTHWGTLSASETSPTTINLQGSSDALNLPGGLTGTINGPGMINNAITVTASGPNFATAAVPNTLLDGVYTISLNNQYWLMPLIATLTNPSPTVTISNPTQSSEYVGQSVVLLTTNTPGSGGDRYQWYNTTSGTVSMPDTSTSLIIPGDAIGIFTYTVVITDSKGGTGSSSATVTVGIPQYGTSQSGGGLPGTPPNSTSTIPTSTSTSTSVTTTIPQENSSTFSLVVNSTGIRSTNTSTGKVRTKFVLIRNLSGLPNAPANFSDLYAINLTSNFTVPSTISITTNYQCGISQNLVKPFLLSNSKWLEINPYSTNQSFISCDITFNAPDTSTIALFIGSGPVNITIVEPTTTMPYNTTAPTTTIYQNSNNLGNTEIAIIIVVAVILVLAAAYFTERSRKRNSIKTH